MNSGAGNESAGYRLQSPEPSPDFLRLNVKMKSGRKDLTARRCGGGESLLQIYGRAEPEAGTYGRVLRGHDQMELGHVRRERRGTGG